MKRLLKHSLVKQKVTAPWFVIRFLTLEVFGVFCLVLSIHLGYFGVLLTIPAGLGALGFGFVLWARYVWHFERSSDRHMDSR